MATEEKEIKDNTGNQEVQDKEVIETQAVKQEPLPDEEDASNLLALINEIDAGDHIIYIGKVLNSDIKKEGKRLLQQEKDFTTTL